MPIEAMPLHRVQLSEDLEAILFEDPAVPLLHLVGAARAGAHYDPAGREGLAALTASLLREGTARRSPDRILEESDDLGADLFPRVDWDFSSLAIELLASDVDRGLDLLFDLLDAPVFPPESLARLRGRQVAKIQQQRLQPAAVADRWLARALYGRSRYGRPLLGDEASLARITREDVARFHQARFGAQPLTVIAVGCFRAGEMADRLARRPRVRRQPGAALPPAAEPVPVSPPSSFLVDVPGAAHTEIRIGHLGVPASHPEMDRLALLALVLERRLRQLLRERLGIAYRVRTRFAARGGAGPFSVSAGVGHEQAGRAVAEILGAMERLQQEPVSEEELHEARQTLTGNLLRSLQPLHGLAARLKRLATAVPDEDLFQRTLRQVETTDPETLRDLARRHLHPDRPGIVLAGSAAELRQPWLRTLPGRDLPIGDSDHLIEEVA